MQRRILTRNIESDHPVGQVGSDQVQLYSQDGKLYAQLSSEDAVLIADLSVGATPVGVVNAFAGSDTAPAGWLLCNGDPVTDGSSTVQGQTADFSNLYALLGTTYGSAGTLPDLAGRVIAQEDSAYDRGDEEGAASVDLAAANIPVHGHTVTTSLLTASVTDGSYGNPYAMNCEPDTYATKPYKWVNMDDECSATTVGYQRHASHAKTYSESFTVGIGGSASVDNQYGNGSGVDGVDVRQPTLYMNYIIKF